MTEVKAPWLKSKDEEVPATLTYSDRSMAGRVSEMVHQYPLNTALEFMGRRISYRQMMFQIERSALSLRACGVQDGDRVMICLPNCPQAIYWFYAINMVGGIATMVHPLSAESEIAFFLNDSKAKTVITLDQFYPKFENIRDKVQHSFLVVVTSVADELPAIKSTLFRVTSGRKNPRPDAQKPNVLLWSAFLRLSFGKTFHFIEKKPSDPAVILYSGGTTGITKGILLSNLNFNALSAQIVATNPFFRPGHKMLAIMPVFHGFGLGVSIHSMLANGGQCILIPRFSAETYAGLLKKYRPNLIAGVPSLFEMLLRSDKMRKVDLSSLIGVFSGGDSLPVELKKRFDQFLHDHGCQVSVREGYGMTECVTASCLTPIHKQIDGSIGIPFPDTFYKIVRPGTDSELPYGKEGEICISGPTVMMEYVNQKKETESTLRVHRDGRTWVHSGDLGVMDENGFIYFRQRIKRMIITNGYNVYPSQLENIILGHPAVRLVCVIGVKDPVKIQKVKAFIAVKKGYQANDALKEELFRYCRKNIAKYAMPYEIEFRDDLPKTLVGKVAYRVLEEEEEKKNA